MADALPTANYYKNLGGINVKASAYEMSTAQFLDLRNLDFDVPNALQKRPGSTQAVSAGTSGPIQALHEFSKLTGESYIVAASDTALFYLAGQAYTLLSSGWNNGQPPDMLTFVNKLWACNGQSWISWSGNSGAPAPVGLPISTKLNFDITGGGENRDYVFQGEVATGGSYFIVNGATMVSKSPAGLSHLVRAIYVAYTYNRSDGYQGPGDFQNTARNIVTASPGNATEFFGSALYYKIGGFTAPSGQGISSISIWFAEDTISYDNLRELIPGVGFVLAGRMGWMVGEDMGSAAFHYASITLKPNADLSRFWLYTTIPTSSLFVSTNTTGISFLATTFLPSAGGTFGSFDAVASLGSAFSGVPFNFFATYIPKYQEVNQNVMFYAGFSASPSQVWFSNLGQPENLEADSFFEVRTNDGDRVTGLKAFNNQLVITKEKSFSKLIGNSADNFELVDLSQDFGCLSQRTILTKDSTVYWLDRKGILEFTGAHWQIMSGPIEPIFRRMNLSAAKEKACGVHHISRNQLWWGIPVDGSTQNNLTVIYDYLVGAWTFFDGFNAASFVYAQGPLAQPTVWRGDYSGFIHYTGQSFMSDSGRGITCMAFTRFDQTGGENQTSLWRRLFLDTAASSGATGAITGQVFANFDTSTVQATFQMAQSAFQSRVEMGVPAKAVAAKFSHYSASLPLLINGYGWAKRPLRNV
jgi:hypothetical protein